MQAIKELSGHLVWFVPLMILFVIAMGGLK